MEEDPIDLIQIKICNRCGEPKPLDQFRVVTKNYKRKDGSIRTSKHSYCYCWKCESDRIKEYTKNNPQYNEKRKKAANMAWKKNGDRYVYERRAKENIGRAFKRRPKPILGYELSKSEDGMWRFLKIK